MYPSNKMSKQGKREFDQEVENDALIDSRREARLAISIAETNLDNATFFGTPKEVKEAEIDLTMAEEELEELN